MQTESEKLKLLSQFKWTQLRKQTQADPQHRENSHSNINPSGRPQIPGCKTKKEGKSLCKRLEMTGPHQILMLLSFSS